MDSIEIEGKMAENNNKDHARHIYYIQRLFNIITEESSDLVIEQGSCNKILKLTEEVSCFSFDYTICNFMIHMFFYECRPIVNCLHQSSEADNSFQE